MKTIIIAGGSGNIGKILTNALIEEKYNIIILTRDANKLSIKEENITYSLWDPLKLEIDAEVIKKADYVINLAGSNLAMGRWTPEKKKEIVHSRIFSGRTIVEALSTHANKVKAVISASAVGWYGPDHGGTNIPPFTEDQPAYDDFIGKTCRVWEENINPITELDKRLVILRFGLVLMKDGGIYQAFEKPINYHIMPIIGDGRQIYSWIHIDDIVGIIKKSIEDEKMSGIYNAVSPQAISQKHLVKTMAKLKHGEAFIPLAIPRFASRLALGEMSTEVLKSATASSQKIQKAGYKFKYQRVSFALASFLDS